MVLLIDLDLIYRLFKIVVVGGRVTFACAIASLLFKTSLSPLSKLIEICHIKL
jgi:hypothetical protein